MKIKIRVRQYADNYYIIQYKGKYSFFWTTLTRCSLWDMASLCKRTFPWLLGFEEAKRIAKTLSYEKIKEMNNKRDIKYNEWMVKIKERDKERANKTFVIEA